MIDKKGILKFVNEIDDQTLKTRDQIKPLWYIYAETPARP